jgi:septum formation protein
VNSLSGKTIVLASSSARRKELLQGIGLDYVVFPSSADETIDEAVEPADYVRILAERKAQDVAQEYGKMHNEEFLVIGADTIVVLDGKVLGKPSNPEDAVRMLKDLQGKIHDVYTGVCVVDGKSGVLKSEYCRTKVTMKKLDQEKIQRYVATGEPLDKAGAYGIQGKGALLIKGIEGDYFSVVGLPLGLTSDLLEEFGVQLL